MRCSVLKHIYYCYAGAHASVVAAAIHCKILPSDRIATWREIVNVPGFDSQMPKDIGKICYMQADEIGNDIYYMGMLNQRNQLSYIFSEILFLENISAYEYRIQDVFPCIGLWTKIGGILSKKFHLFSVGRFLCAWGIKKNYYNFLRIVQSVKENKR